MKLGSLILGWLCLQSWIRGRLQRMRYMRLRRWIVCLQRAGRVYMQRRVEAATTLQAAVRGWIRRRVVERQHNAAVLIRVRFGLS